MKNKTQFRFRFESLPKDYSALCRLLLPRPIRDSVDYDNVAEIADAMALWQDDFSTDQRDYFDMLCALIEDYDASMWNGQRSQDWMRSNTCWPNMA